MCGIFGLVRNTEAPHPEKATAAFIELGRKSVERGRDSAGFALAYTDRAGTAVSGATYRHATQRRVEIDHVHVVKDTCPFGDLWVDEEHTPMLAVADVAIGHTRWATQGKRDALTNASPMIVGSLVGTHNGDVDTFTVKDRAALPLAHGSTDTEVLFQAINKSRHDRRRVTEVLRTVEGRAALAWLDRHHPNRVYLARAALSPLSTAYDAEGNFYWASNPRWFREIDEKFDGALGFHDIRLVTEGSLLTVTFDGTMPVVDDTRSFTPKCRPSDKRLGDGIVWRGFDPADREADKAALCHKVAKSRYAPKSGTSKSGGWTGNGGWNTPGVSTNRAPANHRNPKGKPASTSRNSGGLLNYFDDLDNVETQKFGYYASEQDVDRWAVEPEDQSDPWDEYDRGEIDEDEAITAAEQFYAGNYDDSTLTILHQATTMTEIHSLMEEFSLTSVNAFHQFRDLIDSDLSNDG